VDNVAARHERFALRDVTFGSVVMPGATLDCWLDSGGISRWSVRILARSIPAEQRGILVGTRTDGRVVRGEVVIGRTHDGGGNRRETMLELHGEGPLEVDPA
jgi:hypothetical protein